MLGNYAAKILWKFLIYWLNQFPRSIIGKETGTKGMKYQAHVCGREFFTVYPLVSLLFWTMWMHCLLKEKKICKKSICNYRALCLFPNTKHRVWHLTDVQSLENGAWAEFTYPPFREGCNPGELSLEGRRVNTRRCYWAGHSQQNTAHCLVSRKVIGNQTVHGWN